jgi:hypothetical protein
MLQQRFKEKTKSKGYLKMDDNIQAYEKQYKVKMFKTGLSNPYSKIAL